MAARKRKPYQVQLGPQAQDIDSMFEELYRRVTAVESAVAGSGNGGGGSTPASHDLLDGSVHSDTTAGSPVTGDIITAQASKWARKAAGTNGQVLGISGGVPDWLNQSALTGVPVGGHDLLSTEHEDTTPAAVARGALVVGVAGVTADVQKFWLDGQACDILPNANDPGSQKFWLDGLAMGPLESLGPSTWQRLLPGPPGSVLTSDGSTVDWQDSSALIASGRGARAYRSTDLPLSVSTPTIVPFDTEVFDDGAFWTAGAPTRLTIPSDAAGIYVVVGAGTMPTGFGGHFYLELRVNGSRVARANNSIIAGLVAPYEHESVIASILKLNANDYVELWVEWNYVSGSYSLVGGSAKTYLSIAKV